jgi:hypothetical protein
LRWNCSEREGSRVVPGPDSGGLVSSALFGKLSGSIFGACKGGVTFGHWGALSREVLRWDWDWGLKVEGDAYGVDVRQRDDKPGQHVGTGSEP